MLKKVLLSATLLAAAASLSSCSYYKNFMGMGTKTENDKQEEAMNASMDPNPDVNPNDAEGTLLGLPEGRPHMHPNNIRPVRAMDPECMDGTYKSPSDKVQTLGYLKPGYKLPEPKKPYVYKGEHKKPVHKKKAAPKVVKKDAYNSDAPKPEVEAKPMMDNKPVMNDATAPVSNQAPAVPMKSPEAPAATPPAPAAPGMVPPAPGSVPPAPPAPGMAPAAPGSVPPAPGMAPAPVAPVMPAAPVKAPEAPAANVSAAPVVSSSPTAPAAVQAPSNTISVGRVTSLDYQEAEVDISATNSAILDQIAGDLKATPTKNVRIQSYGYAKDANAKDARRDSLQRAIKIRKYLIDKDVNASRISVNAIEDVNNKSNRVEISFEELKAQ